MAPGAAPRIFINYRREDSAGHAGRLYDALAQRFGHEHVFMDVDGLDPGENFARVLDDRVGSCDVFVALIGRHWKSAVDREGRPRLERPEDFVRLEVQRALESARTRVIPTLVQGAEMPSSDDLPAGMSGLATRHAIELSDNRWNGDVERLIRAIENDPRTRPSEPFGRHHGPAIRPVRPPGDGTNSGRRVLVGVVAALTVVVIAAGTVLATAHSGSPTGDGTSSKDDVLVPSDTTTTRTLVASAATTHAAVAAAPTTTHAAVAAAPTTITSTLAERTVAPAIRYVVHAGRGYQATLPTGAAWTRPADSEPVPRRLYRTSVRRADGLFVMIDYTPHDKPIFDDAYEKRSTVSQPAFGSAMRYVFRGGKFPDCHRVTCVDYQIQVPGTDGGLAVLVGGPDLSETKGVARRVATSLTAAPAP